MRINTSTIYKGILAFPVIIALGSAGFAQTVTKGSNPAPRAISGQAQRDTSADLPGNQRDSETLRVTKAPDTIFQPVLNPSPQMKLDKIRAEEQSVLNEDAKRVMPPGEYYAKYAAFLKDKKTGIARLYPDKNCFADETVVSVKQAEKCADLLPVIGDGSYYSFRLRSSLNQKSTRIMGKPVKTERADIHYVGGRIEVGSLNVQGLIAEVSDTKFEALDKSSAEVKFLKDYKPKSDLKDVAGQKKALMRGIEVDGITYSDSVAARTGSVYILRSIAYRHFTPLRLFTKEEMYILDKVIDDSDLRIDTTVAFKLIGQEPDGSLIILWKELSQKPAPILKGLFK